MSFLRCSYARLAKSQTEYDINEYELRQAGDWSVFGKFSCVATLSSRTSTAVTFDITLFIILLLLLIKKSGEYG